MKKVTLFIFLVSILTACTPAADAPPPNDQPDLTGTTEEPSPGITTKVNQSQTDQVGLKITLHRVEVTETGAIVNVTFENTSKKTIKISKKPNIYFHTPDNLLIRAANKPLEQYEETGMKPGDKTETDILLNSPIGSRLIPEEIKEMRIIFGSSASSDDQF